MAPGVFMDIEDVDGHVAEFERLVRSGSEEAVNGIADNLGVLLLMSPVVPDRAFAALAALLGDETFLRARLSWKSPRLLDGAWECLSDEQRSKLKPILIATLGKFSDWLGDFVTVEMLGKRYPTQDTLEFLVGFSDASARGELALRGIEVLVDSTENPETKRHAMDAVERMAKTAPGPLHREARELLDRLRGKG